MANEKPDVIRLSCPGDLGDRHAKYLTGRAITWCLYLFSAIFSDGKYATSERFDEVFSALSAVILL